MIKSLCLYCGSRPGVSPSYAAAAAELGTGLARRGLTLVYGGGSIGLMGIAARAALEAGGHVVGIIPDFLNRAEVGLADCSELVIVDSMHERKRLMFERADAFVVLPGGAGTLDETVEIITWAQLRLHDKPILLVGGGFWRPFMALIDHFIAQGFVSPDFTGLFRVVESVDSVWPLLAAEKPSARAANSGML